MPTDLTPLINSANTVKSETGFKKNTAIRIGNLFLGLIGALGEIELTPGPNGQNALLRVNESMLQWKLSDAVTWIDLFNLATLQGEDGKEVTLQRTSTHIQWRLGTGTWVDLIPLADITGANGKTVLSGTANPGAGVGTDGDFYLNTATSTLFGPKAAGAWPTGVSLLGAAGAAAVMTRISTTSLAVGTGSRTFNYAEASNLGWTVGQRLRATSGTNFMEGVVDSVSSTVVTLIVDLIGGSGTHATWNIGVAGQQGSPDTPAQIRDKINTLTGEDRIPSSAIKDLPSSEGSLNTDQFATVETEKTLRTVFTPSAAHRFDFTQNRDIGTLEAPLRGELDVVRTGGLNKVQVVVISASVRTPAMLVDPLVQPWGTKPSWLIVTGNAYATGFKDVNELTFTFHKVWKDGSTSIQNAVVCNIVAHPNFDQETTPWYENLLVNAMYNDNRALAATDTLINNVAWDTADSEIRTEAGNNMAFTLLSGSNYAIRTGQTSGTRLLCILSNAAKAKMENKALTVISRFRGGNATGNRVIASNIDTANTRGFAFYHNNSDQIIRFEQGLQDSTNRIGWATGQATNSENWIEAAVQFKGTDARIWGAIAAASLPFGLRATKTNYPTGRNINSGLNILFDRTTTAGSATNWKETDYIVIYAGDTFLPGIVIENIINDPQNAAKIIQEWEHPSSPIIFLNDPQPQAGGFAGLYNGGLGVSGGREGRILEYDNYERLLEDYRNSDFDEREEYRYTGGDFTTTNLQSVATGKLNKSVVGLGQKITGVDHRHLNCDNIIFQNLEIVPPLSSSRDAISFQGCVGFWLHRMTFNGNSVYQNENPTTYADCLVDIGWNNIDSTRSDLFTISDCILRDAEKGILVGFDANDSFGNTGKPRGTIINTWFKNLRQRGPFVRGLVHLVNCLQDYDITAMTLTPLGIAAVDTGQIYIENMYYERGNARYRFESGAATSANAGILDIGSFRNNPGYATAEGSDQPYNSSLVTWTPAGELGYTYPKTLVSPADARTWILANAGATLTSPIL